MKNKEELEVESKYAGERLDVFLTEILNEKDFPFVRNKEISRSLVQKFIGVGVYKSSEEKGNFKGSYKVNFGETFFLDIGLLKEMIQRNIVRRSGFYKIESVKGEFEIVYEDTDLMVIDKEAGVSVHPGIGHQKDTLANFVKYYLMHKGEYDQDIKRAGIVHRLDKAVSGLIIFAKNSETQLFLKEQFRKRLVSKFYLAKVYKVNETNISKKLKEGEWLRLEGFIVRDKSNRKRRRFITAEDFEKVGSIYNNPKKSVTNILKLSDSEFLLNIETGRNHQIRATLKRVGYIVVGDALYMNKSNDRVDKIALQCFMLEVANIKDANNRWVLPYTISSCAIDTLKEYIENLGV